MCVIKPGPRCAADTCLDAVASAGLYAERYPDGPDVDSIACAETVGMLHARVAYAKKGAAQARQALQAAIADGTDDAELDRLRRQEQLYLTEYQISQEALHGKWRRMETRAEQDQAIRHTIEVNEPIETWDAEGYSSRTGLHRETHLDREQFNGAGFKKVLMKSGGREGVTYVNKHTGTHLDAEGYDHRGLRNGIDRRGFNAATGMHVKTGRKFDENGRDAGGFDRRGFDELGFQADGTRYDRFGFDVDNKPMVDQAALVKQRVARQASLSESLGGDSADDFDVDAFLAAVPEGDDEEDAAPVKRGRGRPKKEGLVDVF